MIHLIITLPKYWNLYNNININMRMVPNVNLNNNHSKRLSYILDINNSNISITRNDIIYYVKYLTY